MLRRFFSKLSNSFSQSVVSPRQSFHAPVRIWFEPLKTTGKLEMPDKMQSIFGETKNLSETGVAFVVSCIRVEGHYLVGDERVLNAEVELPEGRIRMQIVGRRYEPVENGNGNNKYLIGASILRMSEGHRQIYENFLRQGIRRSKRAGAVLGAEEA